MDKRKLHHYWKSLSRVKAWHFALLFVVFLGLSVFVLRQNSRGLEPLVTAVVEADRSGGDVESALLELDRYVSSRMNTQLDEPIQLAFSYDRAVQKILEEAQATSEGEIYRKAQEVCENPNVVLSVRAACIQDYITNNATPGQEPQLIDFPDKSLYTHTFISPVWSPDAAGWLLVLTFLSAVMFIVWASGGLFVRHYLKRHL